MPNLASGLQWAETAVMYRRKSSLAGKVYLVKKKSPKNGLFQTTKIGLTSIWKDLDAKLLLNLFETRYLGFYEFMQYAYSKLCDKFQMTTFPLLYHLFPPKPIRPTFMQVLNLAQLYWSRFCYGFGFGFGSIPLVEPFDCVWLLRG